MSTSKTGKHGHAKVHLVAIDIFTGKKLEDISPSTHNMDVPNVSRTEYQLVNIDDGFLNLMTQDGTAKDDVRLPDNDLGKQIQADFDEGKELLVTVTAAMGEEHALGVKEAPKGALSDDEFNDTILTATTTSKTYPMRCSALRKDGHVVIEGRPCKIVDISILETSEGGDAQVHLVALDIFTGKQFEDTSLSTDVMEVPNVSRHEYQLVNIDDGFLNLRTGDGVPKDDIRVPEGDLGSGIERDFHDGNEILVTVIGAMNEEAAISYKNVLLAGFQYSEHAPVKKPKLPN